MLSYYHSVSYNTILVLLMCHKQYSILLKCRVKNYNQIECMIHHKTLQLHVCIYVYAHVHHYDFKKICCGHTLVSICT